MCAHAYEERVCQENLQKWGWVTMQRMIGKRKTRRLRVERIEKVRKSICK